MKLSELVAFRNHLNSIPRDAIKLSADQELLTIMQVIGSQNDFVETFTPKLEKSKKELYQGFENFSLIIDQLKSHINKLIAEQEKYWFQESYTLFEVGMSIEENKDILNRRPSITGENTKHASYQTESILRARLSSYADWRFPGMVIRPGLENFVDDMVGYDPMYIIDQNYDLLTPCLERFPKLYQSRLRTCILNDRGDGPILGKIPNNQFGICLIYNFLNYRPLELIRRYLQEIYEKLRPGGILIMTYNDCDRASAVQLVENYYCCYTPGYLIKNLATNIGYEQNYTWSDSGPSVWLELKKPGQLTSIKGGQALAKIVSK